MEFDNYKSHLHVFENIFRTHNIRSVLEFGMGKYSTTYFASHAELVVSVEQESEEWYEQMKVETSSPNWHHVFQADPRPVFQYFDQKDTKFDLVFSDGKADTRVLVANLAMQKNVPVVVLHDAEKIWYYRWDQLCIGANYRRYDFQCQHGLCKVTSVITNINAELVDRLVIPEHNRIMQAYSSPSQPIIRFTYPGDETRSEPAESLHAPSAV